MLNASSSNQRKEAITMKRLYKAFKNWLYLPDGNEAELYNLTLFVVLALSAIVASVSFTKTLGIYLALIK